MSRSRGKSACGMARHIWEPKRKRKLQARQPTAPPWRLFTHLERRAHPSRGWDASPAARSSMNARGSGASRERRDLTKFVEEFPKPGEGKSKSLGRKSKARGSEIQASFFHESRLFKGLGANPDCEPLFLSDSPLGGRRGRAKKLPRNASPRGWSRACFARAVPQSMPASPPAALAAFLGNQEHL